MYKCIASFFDERIRMYRYYFKLANLVIQINAPFVIENSMKWKFIVLNMQRKSMLSIQ